MKIELKHIHINEPMSHHSYAYRASLYVNDIKAGSLEALGGHESARFDGDRSIFEGADIWCRKNLPPTTVGGCLVPTDLDDHCHDLVADHHRQMEVKEMFATRLFVMRRNFEIDIFQFDDEGHLSSRHLEAAKKKFPHPNVVLNTLPFPIALDALTHWART